MSQHIYLVILAGGQGTRFWPRSRKHHPKQFLDILGQGKSLLRATYDRYKKWVPPSKIFVITNKKYVSLVKEQLPALEPAQILSEPISRNTSLCIAYAAYKLNKLDPKSVMIVAPSDHLIHDENSFGNYLKNAISFAKSNEALLTLGIIPNRPDVNYGYIQYLEEPVSPGVCKVKTFTEKPNLSLAQEFLRSGDFLWNSGIFVWKTKTILSSFRAHLPEISELFDMNLDQLNSPKETEMIKKIYATAPGISIDYGIMEKAENVYVLPSVFGWSDLGTWNSTWEQSPKDAHGNAVQPENIALYESSNNIIHLPAHKTAYIQGIEGLCVIDTGDILMICRREDDHFVKKFQQDIREAEKGDLL